MPSVDKSLAELAEILKGYIQRSGKTQRQVAEEAGVPNPSYLSHMANGRINWIESDYFRPLTIALGMKVAEIAELKPDLILTPDEPALAPRRGPPIPPVVGPVDVPLEIPNELQELIDEYGDRPGYEALRNRKSLQTLSVHRAYLGEEDGPQTADQWHEYFLSLRRWLPK